MVDPAVAYQPNTGYDAFDRGVEQGVFLREANGSLHKGVVWPGVTVYPGKLAWCVVVIDVLNLADMRGRVQQIGSIPRHQRTGRQNLLGCLVKMQGLISMECGLI